MFCVHPLKHDHTPRLILWNLTVISILLMEGTTLGELQPAEEIADDGGKSQTWWCDRCRLVIVASTIGLRVCGRQERSLSHVERTQLRDDEDNFQLRAPHQYVIITFWYYVNFLCVMINPFTNNWWDGCRDFWASLCHAVDRATVFVQSLACRYSVSCLTACALCQWQSATTQLTMFPSLRNFSVVEPPWTNTTRIFMLSWLCDGDVRVGSTWFNAVETSPNSCKRALHAVVPRNRAHLWASRWFDAVKPPRTSAQLPNTESGGDATMLLDRRKESQHT